MHKRTASGATRATSRNADERRFEERRVTERTYETHVERVARATSPDRHRRSGAPETRADAPRHKTPELKVREQRAETPQG
jgi:gamma-tubulin complex component 2